MHTVSRVFTRLSFAALCALIVTLALAATASAVTVNLRVEGPSETLFNGPVTTGPRAVAAEDLPGANVNFCDADGAGDQSAANATGNTAIADSGLSYGTSGTRYGFGTAMCRIGAVGTTASDSWTVKINNKTGGFANSGDTPLADGDTVLWYFGPWTIADSLDLVLPATVGVGQTLTGRVDSWDNATDVQSPAAGAIVSGGGASATSGADGTFSLSFATAGSYLVTAVKGASVRGSARVTVTDQPAELPQIAPLKPVNRFARCGKLYGKDSPKHRRCIKVARAKQRAECRKRSARSSSVCRTLAKRER